MSAQRWKTEKRINGVSLVSLFGTIEAIQQADVMAKYQFRVRNQWLDGGLTRTTVKDYLRAGAKHGERPRPFVIDSGIALLPSASNQAMDPLEYLLVAIGASVTNAIVWHAAANGIHLDGINTWVEGDIDIQGCLAINQHCRPGYEAIRVTVQLDAEMPDSKLDELLDLAVRYSPIFDTISCGTLLSVIRQS
ncbi:MAG: OsmC family protein [Amphritea sp.]